MGQDDEFFIPDEQQAAFCKMMLSGNRQYGVMFYDLDRRITGWNAGATFITGWTPQDMLGELTRKLFVPEDRERRLDEHEADTAAVVGVGEDERWHMRKDGSRFWSSGMSLPMKNDDGALRGFVKIFRDATHLRVRTRYLENELQANTSQRAERSQFLGTIAHEMRNPLSPLKSAVQLMGIRADQPDAMRSLAPVMARQVDALERLVEDLVDVTRVQTGKMSIVYERATYQQILDDAVASCRPAAGLKRIGMHLVAPSVPIPIEVDTQRFMQVLTNLINNAIKFTPVGGNIWLTATADQTHTLLYLKDDGRGIAPDLLPEIFEVFTQATSATSERGAGVGIGLSIVKEIVALHQGTVEVRSEGIGKGTEFVVRMPLRAPQGVATA